MKKNSKEKKKKQYVAPTIGVTLVQLENGIAAGSNATLSFDSDSDPTTPEVEDWLINTESLEDRW